MKHVISAILLGLAWCGLFGAGRLSAQQLSPPDESILVSQPESIPPGTLQPASGNATDLNPTWGGDTDMESTTTSWGGFCRIDHPG